MTEVIQGEGEVDATDNQRRITMTENTITDARVFDYVPAEGERVQVDYSRFIDRQDDGVFYIKKQGTGEAEWWPIYGDSSTPTVGYGEVAEVKYINTSWYDGHYSIKVRMES